MSDRQDLLLVEYEKLAATHRVLVDVRFKLLAFIPAVTGVGLALLKDASASRLSVAVFGLIVTIGVVIYEIRNSQIHDAAVHMQRELANHLGLLVYGRPRKQMLFGFVKVWHDRALGIIYGTCVGAWAALVAFSSSGWIRDGHAWAASFVGLLIGSAVYWQIIRINKKTGNDLSANAPTASQWSAVGQIDQLPAPARPRPDSAGTGDVQHEF